MENYLGYTCLKLHSIALSEDGEDPAAPRAAKVGALEQGSTVDGVFVLRKASVKTASNGKPYFSGLLTDNSGWIPVRVWNYAGSLSEKDNGKRVAVKGTVTSFRDMLQVEAAEIQIVE